MDFQKNRNSLMEETLQKAVAFDDIDATLELFTGEAEWKTAAAMKTDPALREALSSHFQQDPAMLDAFMERLAGSTEEKQVATIAHELLNIARRVSQKKTTTWYALIQIMKESAAAQKLLAQHPEAAQNATLHISEAFVTAIADRDQHPAEEVDDPRADLAVLSVSNQLHSITQGLLGTGGLAA